MEKDEAKSGGQPAVIVAVLLIATTIHYQATEGRQEAEQGMV